MSLCCGGTVFALLINVFRWLSVGKLSESSNEFVTRDFSSDLPPRRWNSKVICNQFKWKSRDASGVFNNSDSPVINNNASHLFSSAEPNKWLSSKWEDGSNLFLFREVIYIAAHWTLNYSTGIIEPKNVKLRWVGKKFVHVMPSRSWTWFNGSIGRN